MIDAGRKELLYNNIGQRETAVMGGDEVTIQQKDLEEVTAVKKSASKETNDPPAAAPPPTPLFLQVPEVVLYSILCFVAGPTHRAHVVCHQLAPLSKSVASILLDKSFTLWQALLEGDYGVAQHAVKHNRNTRGASKRRREAPIYRVRDAHLLVKDNTEIAYYYLEELANTPSGSSLTAGRLSSILHEYGPHLRINDRTKFGGTFLVACCRARYTRECHIRQCVELLVETYGASTSLSTLESAQSSLTPLCVAAARGMPSVVSYLLRKGASKTKTSTGRFRLHTNVRKSVKCTDATPLEFALDMRAAEENEGAESRDLKDLDKCIRLLKQT